MSTPEFRVKDAARRRVAHMKDRDKENAKMRVWYKRHASEKRAKQRHRNAVKRQELLSLFGTKCAVCGFSDWRGLQLDHVNGGGNGERQSVGYNASPEMRLAHFRERPEEKRKFQVLCANCNWIKRYEKQENGGPRIREEAQ